MRRAVEPCGLVVDSMVDARSARQSIDGRQLFVAEPPMKQCEAGAVGRVQASDGRSFASMPHHMLHDLRVSRRSDGISESIAIRLNERRSEGASMSDCVCERGAALLCTHKAILQGELEMSLSHLLLPFRARITKRKERAAGSLLCCCWRRRRRDSSTVCSSSSSVSGVQCAQFHVPSSADILSSFSTGLLPRSFARNRNKLTAEFERELLKGKVVFLKCA